MNRGTFNDQQNNIKFQYQEDDNVWNIYLYLLSLRQQENRQKQPKKVQHGHIFGYNRKCECGLSLKTYRLEQPKEICTKMRGKRTHMVTIDG